MNDNEGAEETNREVSSGGDEKWCMEKKIPKREGRDDHMIRRLHSRPNKIDRVLIHFKYTHARLKKKLWFNNNNNNNYTNQTG